MKASKYTLLIIPDNEEKNRQFTLKRSTIIVLISFIALIIIGLISISIYSLPKAFQYQALNSKYNNLASERMEVLSLMRDFQRMKQLDQLIRKTLGTEFKFTPGEGLDAVETDTDQPGFVEDESHYISYVENIPSLAPLSGYVTQHMSKASIFQQNNHYGIDIAVRDGEPVLASAAGQVVFTGWTYDMGNLVIIYHSDGYFTHYGHNQRNLVQRQDFVRRGDVIALAGSTGISSGPHLHFEVWHDGKAIDPMLFFPEYKTTDLSQDSDE